MNRKGILILFASIVVSVVSYAHSGRTNSNGCHTNRKTGEYHCHGKKSGSSSKKTSNISSAKKSSSGSLYFNNCTEARRRGYTNIRKGQSGYASHLDRDKDGIACESR